MPFLPLTLTLSPKGRGEVIFDNTRDIKRGEHMKPPRSQRKKEGRRKLE
jgi:hypothetical protein